MNIDFVRDAKELFRRRLEAMGVSVKHDNDPIISWYIYCGRRIPISRRKVVKAKGFSCPSLFMEKLKSLEMEIENGANLDSYLSRSIMDCSKDDLMLYDWGIYHLHISDNLDTKKSDGFMERSDLLLYALFNDDNAYFIKTMNHKGENNMWTKKECLEIINDNWPHLLEPHIMKGIAGEQQYVSDDERSCLRKNHVNTFITLDNGVVIMPPNMGFMCDGTSFKAVYAADYLKKQLNEVQANIMNDISNFRKQIKSNEDIYEIKLEEIMVNQLNLKVNNHISVRLKLVVKE